MPNPTEKTKVVVPKQRKFELGDRTKPIEGYVRRQSELAMKEQARYESDKKQLNSTGEIVNPKSLKFSINPERKRLNFRQDNRSNEELDRVQKAIAEAKGNSYNSARPLIYLNNPNKLVGDVAKAVSPNNKLGFETSEKDREELAYNSANPYKSANEKLNFATKKGLEMVPAAAVNMMLAGEGAGASGALRTINNALNPLAGSGTNILRAKSAVNRAINGRLTKASALHEVERTGSEAAAGLAKNEVKDKLLNKSDDKAKEMLKNAKFKFKEPDVRELNIDPATSISRTNNTGGTSNNVVDEPIDMSFLNARNSSGQTMQERMDAVLRRSRISGQTQTIKALRRGIESNYERARSIQLGLPIRTGSSSRLESSFPMNHSRINAFKSSISRDSNTLLENPYMSASAKSSLLERKVDNLSNISNLKFNENALRQAEKNSLSNSRSTNLSLYENSTINRAIEPDFDWRNHEFNPLDYSSLNTSGPGLIERSKNEVKRIGNGVKEKLNSLDKTIGSKLDRSDKLPDLEKIVSSANEKLNGGLGVKKVKNHIELKKSGKGNDVDVHINGERTGYITLSRLEKEPRKFTEILRGKSQSPDLINSLGSKSEPFQNGKFNGFAKQGDFPFDFMQDETRKSAIKRTGTSGEINKAISESLKEKNSRLYSGGTGHTGDGQARYDGLLGKGLVEDITLSGRSGAGKIYMYKKYGGNLNLKKQ